MNKIISLFVILISITSCKNLQNEQSLKKKALFNGKNLNNWQTYGEEKWYINDGHLICENGEKGNFGYLATQKKYKNFELTLEFKKNIKSNGGIFIHSEIENTNIKEGWQVEIAIPTHFTGGIHKYNKGWLIKPDLEKDSVIKTDSWNTMKLIVNDKQLTTWINGTQMATIIDEKLATTNGRIALQIHKGDVTKIYWRNIFITEI